jgi:hypothetical protein
MYINTYIIIYLLHTYDNGRSFSTSTLATPNLQIILWITSERNSLIMTKSEWLCSQETVDSSDKVDDNEVTRIVPIP